MNKQFETYDAGEETAAANTRIFLYLIYHDFAKIYGPTQI
jgi:hypothetical protein